MLDGLERAQADGGEGRARGELVDLDLRELVRAVASGACGRTRAIITSRYRVVDTQAWDGAGARTVELDALSVDEAAQVLKDWGVGGGDAARRTLAEATGLHALTVSVLGSYLHDLGGDPTLAPSFELSEAEKDNPEAARLKRVLDGYALRLPADERDLLIRLSLYPNGVGAEILRIVVDAGGNVAGALVRASDAKLLVLAHRLRDRALAYAFGEGRTVRFSAHPAVRQYFADPLGIPPEELHEAVRAKLAPTLEANPEVKPTETEVLDRYEQLIEVTRLAGRVEEAFALYRDGLGRENHLGWQLGELRRGLRIVEGFIGESLTTPGLPVRLRGLALNQLGLFRQALGDLAGARSAAAAAARAARSAPVAIDLATGLDNLAMIDERRGALYTARQLSSDAAALEQSQYHANHATWIRALLGESIDVSFAKAAAADPQSQRNRPEWGSRFALMCGATATARREFCAILDHPLTFRRDAQFCSALLARCDLADGDLDAARARLTTVREWTARSGHFELTLESHEIASALALATNDAPTALTEALTGLTLAEGRGWGLIAIDLRIAAARAHLPLLEAREALRFARAALDAATDPECGYAWGEADAAHVCGVAHARLDEPELARMRFEHALAIRTRIAHPRAHETEAELAKLD